MNYSRATDLLCIFIIVILMVFTGQTSAAEDDVLLNGTGIYIETGDAWTFEQGYSFVIRGVNEDNSKVWVDLWLDNNNTQDMIMQPGEMFVYSTSSGEILNITLDSIYYGPEGELVMFKPVYQYLDPELPEPSYIGTEDINISTNSSSEPKGDEDYKVSGFEISMTILCLLFAILISRKKEF